MKIEFERLKNKLHITKFTKKENNPRTRLLRPHVQDSF